MKLAIIGTGYVGLVTGTCFAETGNMVTCIDIDRAKIERLREGKIPIYEPGLEPLFKRNRQLKRLQFTTDLSEGIRDAEVIFLALPTPEGEDGSANLQFVLNVADQLGRLLHGYAVIVDKSTTPVGTAEKVRKRIGALAKFDFDVVVNPEFLREGVAVDDFMKPDRVVLGTRSSKAAEIMETLYSPFLWQSNSILFMDERSAELTKYAANAYLATRISFMNEIANLCELLDCNAEDVRRGLGTDSRIGNRFLFPGIGYGGSCFPKDVRALSVMAEDVGYNFRILTATMSVNKTQRVKLVQLVKDYFRGNLRGKTIAVWGLSFKPHTDDIREAPALYHIKAFLEAGAIVKVYDPEGMENTSKAIGNKVQYLESAFAATNQADCLVIMTEWPEFCRPDFNTLAKSLKNRLVFDGRNLFDPDLMHKLGFTYFSVGRKVILGNDRNISIGADLRLQTESSKNASITSETISSL